MLLCSTFVVFLVLHSNKSTKIISTFMEKSSVKVVLYWWSWQILQQIICLEVIRNLLVALKESVPIIWQTCNEELHEYHLSKMQENPSLHRVEYLHFFVAHFLTCFQLCGGFYKLYWKLQPFVVVKRYLSIFWAI